MSEIIKVKPTQLFKLTTVHDTSYHTDSMLWGENVTNSIEEVVYPKLCSSDVIHAYRSPYQAVVFDRGHCGLLSMGAHLWLAKGTVVVEDAEKVGVFSLTTIKLVPIPKTSTLARRTLPYKVFDLAWEKKVSSQEVLNCIHDAFAVERWDFSGE